MSRSRDTADQINRVDSSAANATAITIDSSENVLIGRTSSSGFTTSSGSAHFPNGSIFATVDGGQALNLSRLTSDGSIAGFYKNGSAVGSIGTAQSGDRTYFAGGSYGIASDTSEATIMPCGTTGTGNDGVVSLGKSDARFKDLHLSGTANVDTKIVLDNLSSDYYGTSFQINNTNADFSGALLDMRATSGNVNSANGRFLRCYSNNGSSEKFHVKGSGEIYTASGILLGGTGAANKLDDYEEGTWTPTFYSTGTATLTYARYVKIGNTVTFWVRVGFASGVTANSSRFTLPFNTTTLSSGTWTRGTLEGGFIEPQQGNNTCYFASSPSAYTGLFILSATYSTQP